jgi:PHD-finger
MATVADSRVASASEICDNPFSGNLSSNERTEHLVNANRVMKEVPSQRELRTVEIYDIGSDKMTLTMPNKMVIQASVDVCADKAVEKSDSTQNQWPSCQANNDSSSSLYLSWQDRKSEDAIECTSDFAGHFHESRIEYVGEYLKNSSEYKTLWLKPCTEGHVEVQKIHRNKRIRSVENGRGSSMCILSVDGNAADFVKHPESFPLSDSTQSNVRIGMRYQAFVHMAPRKKNLLHRSETTCISPLLMWDPQQAEVAKRSGEDIDGFLSRAGDLNLKLLLMEALHKGHYSVSKATQIFVSLYGRKHRLSLGYGNAEDFLKIFSSDYFTKTKDFEYVASKLNCTKEVALVNFYRWKKSKPNNPDQYLKMKRERNKESDVCDVCDNGGNLIVCDLCNKAYHFFCLTPPLTVIPQGEWFCPECETRSPAKLRRHLGFHKMNHTCQNNSTNSVIDRNVCQIEEAAWMNVAAPERLQSLKCIHKELFSNCLRSSRNFSPLVLPPPLDDSRVKVAEYSPAGMTWDVERGFWTENDLIKHHDASLLESSENTKLPFQRAVTSISSWRSHADRDHLTIQHGNKSESKSLVPVTCSKEAKNGDLTMTNPLLLRGQTYEVRLPITPEGLLIYIKKISGRFTSFSGYRQTSTGEIGFAQKSNAFIANGDFILEVDNVSCFNQSFAQVRSMLKVTHPGSTMKVLKMFHPLNVKMLDSLKEVSFVANGQH